MKPSCRPSKRRRGRATGRGQSRWCRQSRRRRQRDRRGGRRGTGWSVHIICISQRVDTQKGEALERERRGNLQLEVEPRRLGFTDRDGRVVTQHRVQVVVLRGRAPTKSATAWTPEAREYYLSYGIVVVDPDAEADVTDLVLRVEAVRDQRRFRFRRDGHAESHRRGLCVCRGQRGA